MWEWWFLTEYLCCQEQVHKCIPSVTINERLAKTCVCYSFLQTVSSITSRLYGWIFFSYKTSLPSSQLLPDHAGKSNQESYPICMSLSLKWSFYWCPPTIYILFCVMLPFQQREKWHPEIKSSVLIFLFLRCLLSLSIQHQLLQVMYPHLFHPAVLALTIGVVFCSSSDVLALNWCD